MEETTTPPDTDGGAFVASDAAAGKRFETSELLNLVSCFYLLREAQSCFLFKRRDSRKWLNHQSLFSMSIKKTSLIINLYKNNDKTVHYYFSKIKEN